MTDTAAPTGKPARAGRFNWLVWPVTILGLLAAGTYGYERWRDSQQYITTDNAQVQGRLVKILAPENGFLERVAVQDNQKVAAGELLANLENRYYQLEVNRAQANLNALLARKGDAEGDTKDTGLAQAKLATAKANLEVVQAQLAEAQSDADQANATLKKIQGNKLAQTFVQSQLDMAQASADQANARLMTLQKEAFAAEQQVQEATANAQLINFNIEQARAELAQARLSLDNTVIKSPVNGQVAQLSANPGVMVEAAQYLMTVVSSDDKWLVANIKETEFERVRVGDFVDITIDAFPGTLFKGMVTGMAPAAGNQFSIIPRNNASGNFIKIEALIPVRIKFIEPLTEIEKLVPGMSAEVRIGTEPPPPHAHAVSRPKTEDQPKEKAPTHSPQPPTDASVGKAAPPAPSATGTTPDTGSDTAHGQ